MEAVFVAAIAAVPATIASMAAWRQASQANKKIANGDVPKGVKEESMVKMLLDIREWCRSHDEWHRLVESGYLPSSKHFEK